MHTLLIDTCGDGASIALADGSNIVVSRQLPARAASAMLLTEVRAALAEAGWSLPQLNGIGVVSGPGSFTGVRVGLSCAKGLCEALALPLTAVSRLEVLATAAQVKDGFAVFNAGRGQVFARDVEQQTEFLQDIDAFSERAAGKRVVVAEEILLEKLGGMRAEMHPLSASSALPLVLQRFTDGGDDISLADANYVRSEQQIYGKPPSVADVAG